MPVKIPRRRTRRYGVKAIQNRAIDDSHTPFKRSKRLGPGPKRSTKAQTGEWTCEYVKPYVQKCTSAKKSKRTGKKKVKIIKIDRAYKKRYNKAHWEHQSAERERHGGPKYSNDKQGSYRYRPSKAPARKRVTKRRGRGR
jgi:hypothetical protein